MSIPVRLVLLIGAVFMLLYVARGIKKTKFKAQETFYWLLLSVVFVLLSIFPGVVEWFSVKLGVATPVNLIFLVVIFLLIVKIFTMDRKLAKTEHQLTEMTQKIAIDNVRAETKEP